MITWSYPFDPHPKQKLALQSTAREVLYGGAVAGGKSEVLLAACVDLCTLVPNAKALIVRRSMPELLELHERLRSRLPSFVATFSKQSGIYTFFNNAKLVTRYLDSQDDATKVQGFEVQLACFDELTHYEQAWYAEVVSRLRATGQVKEDMDRYGLKLRALSASNPGGIGHSWVKERFVDPAPMGTKFVGDDGTERLFIQATLYDNPFIDHEDYIRNSLGALDPERRRALLEGDWGIPAGTRFPQFRESVHVIKPEQFPIPPVGVARVVGVDYGISDPFAAVWAAKVGDTIVVYRDHVESGLAASQQAQRVLELESEEERLHSDVTVALDPNGWARNPHFGGVKMSPGSDEAPLGSIAYSFRDALGDRVVKGWNPRVQGWAIFDELMIERDTGVVDEDGAPVKLPRILIYDTCRDLIKALQSAPRAKRDPQDVDTSWKDDHVCFVAGTLVECAGGPRPIESVRPGDLVWTRAGLRRVVGAGMTDPAAVVGDVVLSDGVVLRGTADHPVFLDDGRKVRMDALRYGDRIIPWEQDRVKNLSNSMGTPTRGGQIPLTGPTGFTTGAEADRGTYTGTFMKPVTGRFLRAWGSITKTMTRSTTPRKAESGTESMVRELSARTSTQKQSVVPVHVRNGFEEMPGTHPVFNLTVEGEHEYYANGVLVSNCDAARYCVAELLGMQYQTKPSAHEQARLQAGNRAVTAGVGQVRL